MAGPGEIYSVPDLHCFEDLQDFELGTNNHLYDDPTSTKDSSANYDLDSNSQCAMCSSSLCNDYQRETSIHPQDTSWSEWDPNGRISYHDIWCDDNSWKFASSSDEENSQATQCSASTSTTSPCSSVPSGGTDFEDAHPQAASNSESPQDTPEAQNVPNGNLDEMSEEDIFAVNSSTTPSPHPHQFEDMEDFAWWELSQISSHSSQSSAFAGDLDDSRLVPTLQTIIQNHRHSAGDQVATEDSDDTSNNEERQRNGLLFNSTCAGAEQVVPNWHTEE